MAINRGGGSKRSTAAAPAAPKPLASGVALQDRGVAAAAAATQAAIAQAGQPMDEEYYQKQQERMAGEREADFKRSEHSLRNRIHDSGYVWIDDPGRNETYVGHLDDITDAMKSRKVTHIGLRRRAAERGTKIVWKGGEDVFFLTETHADWGSVVHPETHEPMIPAKADPEKTKVRREQEGLDRTKTELERVNQPGFDAKAENKAAAKKGSKKSSSKKGGSKSSAKTQAEKIERQEATETHGDGSHPADEPHSTGG